MVYIVYSVMMTIGKTIYLTVKEAAAILGISIPTVRLWTDKGILKTKRHPVNHYRLYKKDDVIELLKNIEKGERI